MVEIHWFRAIVVHTMTWIFTFGKMVHWYRPFLGQNRQALQENRNHRLIKVRSCRKRLQGLRVHLLFGDFFRGCFLILHYSLEEHTDAEPLYYNHRTNALFTLQPTLNCLSNKILNINSTSSNLSTDVVPGCFQWGHILHEDFLGPNINKKHLVFCLLSI